MLLPKSITPDRIKNSFIDVRFKSNVPFQAFIGIFFQAVRSKFKYIPPVQNQRILNDENNKENKLTISILENQNLFYNDSIKIQIQPNTIVFNCKDKYIGWNKYMNEVEYVLQEISKTGTIVEYNRVGIRYVSEYLDIDLRGCVKFEFTFGMPDVISNNYQFRSEFESSNHRVILNLKNNLPLNIKEFNHKNISIIDIDVIKENLEITSALDLLKKIEENHNVEKEIFFTLLKKDFLTTLNPTY